MSHRESVEDRDDAAKKRAMDLESAKKNRIQREQIVKTRFESLRQFEHLVNQTPAQYFPAQHWYNFPDVWIDILVISVTVTFQNQNSFR
jgi:hypothetical protein